MFGNRPRDLGLLALQRWLGQRALNTLDALPVPPTTSGPRPPISVVIPARNEAHRLPRLLASLRPALGPADQVIVADDNSTDATAAVARSHGATVVPLTTLPAGWRGKPWACHSGAAAATNPWLLFLDADTAVESPGALDSLLAHALQERLECVSAFLRQQTVTPAEHLLVPFAYRHYLAGRSALHTINGQCILIRRETYTRLGGHEPVRDEVAEDVAYARVLTASAVPFALVDGRDLFSVRMYTSFTEIREGFGKNAGLFLKDDPLPGLLTAASTTLAAAPALFALFGLRRGRWTAAGAAATAYLADAASTRDFATALTGEEPPRWVAYAQPLAQAVFLGIALLGIAGPKLGFSRSWKGRSLDARR